MKAIDGGESGFDLVAFVEASCVRHGVPFKILDAGVHRDVALLLSGRTVRLAVMRDTNRRVVSESPDEVNALGVEAATTSLGGCDHSMVDHGTNDGVLAGQIEFGPLSA